MDYAGRLARCGQLLYVGSIIDVDPGDLRSTSTAGDPPTRNCPSDGNYAHRTRAGLSQGRIDISERVDLIVPPRTAGRSELEHKFSWVDLPGIVHWRLDHRSSPLKVEQIDRVRLAL